MITASEMVLLLESVKDPLDGATLLLGRGEIVLDDLLDDVLEFDGEGSLGSGSSQGVGFWLGFLEHLEHLADHVASNWLKKLNREPTGARTMTERLTIKRHNFTSLPNAVEPNRFKAERSLLHLLAACLVLAVCSP